MLAFLFVCLLVVSRRRTGHEKEGENEQRHGCGKSPRREGKSYPPHSTSCWCHCPNHHPHTSVFPLGKLCFSLKTCHKQKDGRMNSHPPITDVSRVLDVLGGVRDNKIQGQSPLLFTTERPSWHSSYPQATGSSMEHDAVMCPGHRDPGGCSDHGCRYPQCQHTPGVCTYDPSLWWPQRRCPFTIDSDAPRLPEWIREMVRLSLPWTLLCGGGLRSLAVLFEGTQRPLSSSY